MYIPVCERQSRLVKQNVHVELIARPGAGGTLMHSIYIGWADFFNFFFFFFFFWGGGGGQNF